MQVTVQLPDDLALHTDPVREALEAFVIAGYRSEALSHYQASQMLGLSRFDFDGFLMEHGVDEHAYGEDDLAADMQTLKRLSVRERGSV